MILLDTHNECSLVNRPAIHYMTQRCVSVFLSVTLTRWKIKETPQQHKLQHPKMVMQVNPQLSNTVSTATFMKVGFIAVLLLLDKCVCFFFYRCIAHLSCAVCRIFNFSVRQFFINFV